MLTPRRTEVLHVIRDGLANGAAPSYRQIAETLGVTSTTAFSHVGALERDGYLRRVLRAKAPHAGRSIELTPKGRKAKP